MGVLFEQESSDGFKVFILWNPQLKHDLCLISSGYPFNTIHKLEEQGYMVINEYAVNGVKVVA